MKKLSDEEILKLAREIEKNREWHTFKKFADDFYGPKAARISLDFGSEYNDNGGYYTTIESLTVYDAEGEILEPDTSMPGFKDEDEDCVPDDVVQDAQYNYLGDVDENTPEEVDLTSPPDSLPTVFVSE